MKLQRHLSLLFFAATLFRLSFSKTTKSLNIEDTYATKLENGFYENLFKDLNKISTGRHQHTQSDHSSKGFDESEIVVPIRLHHVTGHPVSHGRHFRKRSKQGEQDMKRGGKNRLQRHEKAMRNNALFTHNNSDFDEVMRKAGTFDDVIPSRYADDTIDVISEDLNDYVNHSVANYSLVAFGEHFIFHLTPFDNFLAPHYSLRYLGDSEEERKVHPEVPKHCFYSGYVDGNVEHKVVVSLCRGLFGAFRTDNSDYLIQPEVTSSDPTHDPTDEEGTRAHRIFRRSIRSPSRHGKLICGYVDSETVKDSSSDVGVARHEEIVHNVNRKVKSIPNLRNGPTKYKETPISSKNSKKRFGNITSAGQEEKSGQEPQLQRKKRYISLSRNVEVMVTADNDMLNAHDDVEHYVLTLMAIKGPKVVKDAHVCLHNFCMWQHEHNNPDDSHPNHHDTAVLITGKDICRSEKACDTLGLAELGTICHPRRSCSINEDNGLSTAFTIAHEIGHEFNAPHDNTAKCLKAPGSDQLHVMSPTLDNKAHPWSWSPCSAQYISEFLDNRNGECLLDTPPQRLLSLPIEDPGEIFDANEQCEFIYGKGVKHCSFMFRSNCQRLWCTSKDIRHGCRTPHLPWADGTRCGPRKWCQRGVCVDENRDRVPIDGNWGAWGRFGVCSRSCGGGVKTAKRECNNPKPQYGGRYCLGRKMKFRSCGYQNCPLDVDFRSEQCAAFNDWSRQHKRRIQGVPLGAQWTPKYDSVLHKDLCKLTCQVRSNGRYPLSWYVLRPRVINGTPCSPDSHDICVEGVCTKAGCDHVLGSSAAEDRCGVCSGDGSTCEVVHGSYNISNKIGYNLVALIPAGANNLLITQRSYTSTSIDNNYLVLREASGKYILNGNRSVMKSKQKMRRRSNDVSGKYLYNCDYSGTDVQVEVINCTKPILIDVAVEVLSAGDLMPPDIVYQYNVPRNNSGSRWIVDAAWTQCSSMCSGKMRRKINCASGSNQERLNDEKCRHLPKPSSVVQPCNTHCYFVWKTIPTACSVRCGAGRAVRRFECWKVKNRIERNNGAQNKHFVERVSDSMCPYRRPNSVGPCQGECLSTKWQYSEWTSCSRTCGGGGVQVRKRVCQDTKGTDVGPDHCPTEGEDQLSRPCATLACPQWITSEFAECSVTCGHGLQTRRVWCSHLDGVLENRFCDVTNKPLYAKSCNMHDCPAWNYRWSECSVTCGVGTSVRLRHCVDYNGLQLADSNCPAHSHIRDSKPCSASKNCQVWSEDEDSPFVVSRGLARRGPYLGDHFKPFTQTTTATAAATTTTTTTKAPAIFVPKSPNLDFENNVYSDDTFVINIHRRRAIWRTGSWTPCSASCGNGIRLRYVSCRHRGTMREMEDSACGPPDERPPSKELCQVKQCLGQWRTGDWSKCSTSCGDGIHVRYVGCLYDGRYVEDHSNCIETEKPTEKESCHITSCFPTQPNSSTTLLSATKPKITSLHPETTSTPTATNVNDASIVNMRADNGSWITGTWSQCSTSCLEGSQSRSVTCQDLIGLPASCDPDIKPAGVQVCNMGECPSWRHHEWGECSKTCGGGNRTRAVYCVTNNGNVTQDELCDVSEQPSKVEACMNKRCRRKYHWKKNLWSPCSSTCGRGLKTRVVQCVDRKKNVVSDEMCATLRRKKPKEMRHCRVQRRCPKWRSGVWSQCSASCGHGSQVRRVSCKYKRKVILDQLCDPNLRPDGVRRCNVTSCSNYHWEAEDWSQCSASCGSGLKTREVACRTNEGLQVDPILCSSVPNPKPENSSLCFTGSCDSTWRIGIWSECSSTCNPGIQQRPVHCVYIDQFNYSEVRTDNCDAAAKPHDVRDCNRGSCEGLVFWRVGSWSECSTTCGKGSSVRKVVCSDRLTLATLPDSVCQATPSFQPDSIRHCWAAPCVPETCGQLQGQQGINEDGEYNLKVKGKMMKIYCKSMNTSTPIEYLTLPKAEENYSEIYGQRLINPNFCPLNGSRLSHCSCHRDHPDEGLTVFQKVRFDVRNMRVLGNDFAFSKTSFGRPVSFGVAGDCYSRSNCPQGRFQIDLSGTGLAVSSETTWLSYGISSSKEIHKTKNGTVVDGKCGGYCSRCQTDPDVGLKLQHKT